MLTRRPDEGVAVLAVDRHGHDDAEQKLFDNGAHEEARYLRLTCGKSPLRSFRNGRLFQGRAEGHPGIDQLLHVTIDKHDVAALAQRERRLGLTLERRDRKSTRLNS